MSREIRLRQLITTFGPGSIYIDLYGVPHLIGGLDYWYKKYNTDTGDYEFCEDTQEFVEDEPRLTNLLKVAKLMSPPDYRHIRKNQRGDTPPNGGLTIPSVRFPRWYQNSKTRQMRQFGLGTLRIENSDGGRWKPVRFIAVCASGHISDFPFKQWIGCQCEGAHGLTMTDRGGVDLSSIRVSCTTCPAGHPARKGLSLAGITSRPELGSDEKSGLQKHGIDCPCARTWLGELDSDSVCNEPLVGALINQTNLYFSRTVSALGLPFLENVEERTGKIITELLCWRLISDARTILKIMNDSGSYNKWTGQAVLWLQDEYGRKYLEDDVKIALRKIVEKKEADENRPQVIHGNELEILRFRHDEYKVIRDNFEDNKTEHLKVRRREISEDKMKDYFSSITLIDKLRETTAFFGFDRLSTSPVDYSELPRTALEQLFKNPPANEISWLPCAVAYGEGIYIEIDENRIENWQNENTKYLQKKLTPQYCDSLKAAVAAVAPTTNADFRWASRFLLVHGFAHLLINQLVYESGYSTAALRERIYVSSQDDGKMAALMIYTSAGDSEGTLGGLVRLGEPKTLERVISRALHRALWCSADPVCSEIVGNHNDRAANLAACNSCIMLPETSCETFNCGLDRSSLVGTPENRSVGFFNDFIFPSM